MIKMTTSLRTIEGPTQWSEVTLDTFQRIVKTNDPVMRLSILYGVEYDVLMNEKNLAILGPLNQASAFINTELLDKSLPADGKIKIGHKIYDVPQKLGSYTIGQAIQARHALEKATVYEEVISKAVAIYMQPIMTQSEFTMDLVNTVEELVLQCPVTEVLGTGFFLLQSVNTLWQQANESLESIKVPGSDKDDTIAQAAGIDQLKPLADLSILDTYAQTYGMDPDIVYGKQFNAVFNMMKLWRQRERFQKTFQALKKPLEQTSA